MSADPEQLRVERVQDAQPEWSGVGATHRRSRSRAYRVASLADGELCLEDALYAVLSALWSVDVAASAVDGSAVDGSADDDVLLGDVAASVAGARGYLTDAAAALRAAGEDMSRLLDERHVGTDL